jgi:hypothetical protein
MKCKGTEIEFKSSVAAYWIEKSGLKNHTERVVTKEVAEWLDHHNVETICVRHAAEHTMFFFIRKVTNIYKEGDILGHYLYSFTWKHEETEQ